MTLTSDLDVDILKMYLRANYEISIAQVGAQTGQTHTNRRQTD